MTSLPANVPTELFIDGKWTSGSQGTFDVFDPSTGRGLCSVPRAGLDDLDRALTAAHQAQPDWAASSPRMRGEILRRAFELMTARREEIAFLISLEMGKSRADARSEVTYAAEFFRWFSEEAVRIDGTLRTAPSGTNKILTFKKPVGVALLLTPWNFPAAMAARKIAPALAAGCSVVLKPAEDAPLTALLLAAVLADAGVPNGVVNVLTTDRPGDLVEAALSDRRLRKLSFTGSTGIGSMLLGQAAKRIVNTSMELGGNAPFIVLEDADLDAAVDGAMLAKTRNGGQACTAANRFLIQQSVAAEFASRLATRMAGLRVGPGTEESTELGPMINAQQRRNLADKVSGSVAAGARILCGGTMSTAPGFFYPATVLTDVPRDSPCATEEIFGPIAPIISVTDEDDAICIANASEMGLTAYVYTSLYRGLRISERLEVGMVGLNRGVLSDPAAPFGGVKQSGLGREGGHEGIEEYLETTYVATSR